MKHDWPRYANGDPKPWREMRGGWYECRRCGVVFVGFSFEDADATECEQVELDGFQELTPE